MSKNRFDKIMNSRGYTYLKRITDLICLNFIFCLISILSGFVLFFPGLVALHHICYQMIRNEEYQPYKTFFQQIKEQWSFMWRLELLGMSVLLILGGCAYLYYAYIYNYGYDWFVWFGIIFEIAVTLFAIAIYLHLMIFNNYFKDDTFVMMIRKAALISRRKFKRTLSMMGIFLCFIVLFYLVPYVIPFFGFVVIIFTLEYVNHTLYDNLVREEKASEMKEADRSENQQEKSE